MSDKQYHHGDLRNALIEAGIKMIGEEGEEKLSLRRLASACQVSNAAPYAHFAGKEELLWAIQEHVTWKFMDYLQTAVAEYEEPDGEAALITLGKAYVRFFIQNPSYFAFLFSRGYIKVKLSIKEEARGEETEGNFPPYELLKKCYLRYNAQRGQEISRKQQELELVHLWADVHGIASLALMENVTWDRTWEEAIEELIR